MVLCFQVQKAENNESNAQILRYVSKYLGLEIHMLNTSRIHTICNAISRKLVNHAATSIPMAHVSFNSSKVQKPHQITIANNIVLKALPKCNACRVSTRAMPINKSSSISSYIDIGIPPPDGIGVSFI